MEPITTDRLILRRFTAEDLPAFVAYRSAPGVARFQSWDSSFSMADAQAFLAEQERLSFGQPGEWVQIAAVDRVTGELYGDCAVKILANQPATAEIGVTLSPAHRGKGIAAEAVAAVVGHLFEDLDLHWVYADTDDRNTAVHRLLERLGFRYEARLVEADWWKDAWVTLRTYAILRREWGAWCS